MSVDAGVQWFPGLGFRPAVWTASHRADQVDPARIVPAPDADIAYSAKFDPFGHMPSDGYAWGTWIPSSPISPSASLDAPTQEASHDQSLSFTSGPVPTYEPDWPDICCVIREPADPLPPVAPVPLPASASLLIAAVAVLFIIRRKS